MMKKKIALLTHKELQNHNAWPINKDAMAIFDIK